VREHRDAVRDATLDAAAAVVTRRGVGATMSEIAETAGISRATLYKYFPDVQSILAAWHDRQVAAHLAELEATRQHADPSRSLEAVLEAYALHQRDRGSSALWPALQSTHRSAEAHRRHHETGARDELADFVAALISERVAQGTVRTDVDPAELASYCLHALSAAESLPSDAAIRRLCAVVLAGIRPPR